MDLIGSGNPCIYKDNSVNRRLGRVGKKYSGKGCSSNGKSKNSSSSNKKNHVSKGKKQNVPSKATKSNSDFVLEKKVKSAKKTKKVVSDDDDEIEPKKTFAKKVSPKKQSAKKVSTKKPSAKKTKKVVSDDDDNQSKTSSFVKTVTTKGKGTTERLSAGDYYREFKEKAIGNICDIRKDGDKRCLVLRNNGVPYWAHKDKKNDKYPSDKCKTKCALSEFN